MVFDIEMITIIGDFIHRCSRFKALPDIHDVSSLIGAVCWTLEDKVK
jgi:hypothetical protein